MRIPDSVKVGAKLFRLDRPEVVVDGSSRLWGQCDHSECWIKVAGNLAPGQAEVTFLHEVIHELDTQYDVGLRESQVRRLAYGLMAFLKDNDLLKE